MVGGMCPILKTREMLYRGGAVARDEDETDVVVSVDGRDVVFDDAPVVIGAGSFRRVRGGGDDDDGDGIDRLRIMDTLHDIEVRESIRDLMTGGYATVPSRDEIVDRYRVEGGAMKAEAAARADLSRQTKAIEKKIGKILDVDRDLTPSEFEAILHEVEKLERLRGSSAD